MDPTKDIPISIPFAVPCHPDIDLTLWLSLVNKEVTNVTQIEPLKCAQVFSFLSYLNLPDENVPGLVC